MNNKSSREIGKKHLLIIGKTKDERKKYVNEIINKVNLETFRLPSNIRLFNEYCDYIIKKQLFTPWYEAKSYNINAILEFHYEWISDNNALVVMEEIDLMEEKWKIELLRIYLNVLDECKKGEKNALFIISQENENGLINQLEKAISVRKNERRTKRQIIEQNIKIIDISDM